MSEDQEPEPSRQQNRRWEERNARGKLTTETARGIGIRGRAGCGAGVGEAAGVLRERGMGGRRRRADDFLFFYFYFDSGRMRRLRDRDDGWAVGPLGGLRPGSEEPRDRTGTSFRVALFPARFGRKKNLTSGVRPSPQHCLRGRMIFSW